MSKTADHIATDAENVLGAANMAARDARLRAGGDAITEKPV